MNDNVTLYLTDVSSRVSASLFIKTVTKFLSLLVEVESDITKQKRSALKWVVKDLRGESALITLAPETNRLHPNGFDLGPDVINHTVEGIRLLEERSMRPPHFTNRAAELAQDIAKIVTAKTHRIKISTNVTETHITSRLDTNVEELLFNPVIEIGTIEGRLKMVSVVGTPACDIYDSIYNTPVRFNFDIGILPEIAKAIDKRVGVQGLIIYTADGHPKRFKQVTKIYPFPPDRDLPTADSVLVNNSE